MYYISIVPLWIKLIIKKYNPTLIFFIFYYYIIMEYNEHQKTEYGEQLLKWVSYYKKSRVPYYKLQQVFQDTPILEILRKADPEYFIQLSGLDNFDYIKYINKLEGYLESYIGKKIKRKYKIEMISNYCLFGMLCLILYLCVHCNQKQTFISDILELQPTSQTILMKIIEDIDINIENVMEIKEILEKVEELELENDFLKNQLRREFEKNNDLNQKLSNLEGFYKTIEQQCDSFRKEKSDVMRELNITTISQYIVLYKILQNENNQIFSRLSNAQEIITILQNEKINYKAKIIEDSSTISELNEEIERIKGICKNLRLSTSFSTYDFDQTNHETYSQSNVLKQNKSLYNTELSKSVLINHKRKYSNEDEQILRYKYQYRELINKYEHLANIFENQRELKEDFMNQNHTLRQNNRYLRSQICLLKEIYESMTKAIK